MAANVFNTRLAQANIITKKDFDAKLSSINKKITTKFLRGNQKDCLMKKLFLL